MEGHGHGLISGSIWAFAWNDLKKQHKTCHDRSLGRNLNPRPPEYEVDVLTT